MSLQLAQRLGDSLGFDPAHVALVHARDVSRSYESSAKFTPRVRTQFRRVRTRLDSCLRQQLSLPRSWRGRRLALTSVRLKRGVSLERLARHSASETGASEVQLSRYEKGFNVVNDAILNHWLRGLSELRPNLEPVSLDTLDEISAALRMVHHVDDTLEWRTHQEIPTTGHQLHCPYDPGYNLQIGTSSTLHAAIEIKLVRASQPKRTSGGAGSLVRLIGSRSRGLQIGILNEGTVELLLSKQPFPVEKTYEPPKYELGQHG
ncbi:MAG: hypothetical protein AAGC55_29185, partial [Myxococcota bacterium]